MPLETAHAAAEVGELAELAAAQGNQNAVSDAGVAAFLAQAACRGAVYNVRINVNAFSQSLRQTNMQFVIDRGDYKKAVVALNEALCLNPPVLPG